MWVMHPAEKCENDPENQKEPREPPPAPKPAPKEQPKLELEDKLKAALTTQLGGVEANSFLSQFDFSHADE